jgi:hypothetical protein
MPLYSYQYPPSLKIYPSKELGLGHVTNLKLLQHVQFFLLITSRLPHLFLSLIKHHFFNHTPRLTIQVSQLAILRLDFRDIYLRRRGDNMFPPLHLVNLIQMQLEDFGARWRGSESPC